jgi:signal transduction histidine kinase
LRLAGVDLGTATEIREMMERQVSHMVRLIDDLMEVSRISRGRIELRKESVQLADVIQHALEISQPLIAAAGHQLKVNLPTEPLVLEADSVRLAQVVANLLNNAAKYTQQGGLISLTVDREDSRAKLVVQDNGSGIPPEMQTKIFDLSRNLTALTTACMATIRIPANDN